MKDFIFKERGGDQVFQFKAKDEDAAWAKLADEISEGSGTEGETEYWVDWVRDKFDLAAGELRVKLTIR